jgi:hypothetical protein
MFFIDNVYYIAFVKYTLLVIVIAAIVLRPIVPLIGYALNYEYISTVLCENKDKPEKKCNGKCHLKKQLNELYDEEKSPVSNKPIKVLENEITYFEKCFSFDFHIQNFDTKHIVFSSDSNLYFFDFNKEIFHPPAIS